MLSFVDCSGLPFLVVQLYFKGLMNEDRGIEIDRFLSVDERRCVDCVVCRLI